MFSKDKLRYFIKGRLGNPLKFNLCNNVIESAFLLCPWCNFAFRSAVWTSSFDSPTKGAVAWGNLNEAFCPAGAPALQRVPSTRSSNIHHLPLQGRLQAVAPLGARHFTHQVQGAHLGQEEDLRQDVKGGSGTKKEVQTFNLPHLLRFLPTFWIFVLISLHTLDQNNDFSYNKLQSKSSLRNWLFQALWQNLQ